MSGLISLKENKEIKQTKLKLTYEYPFLNYNVETIPFSF